jgi:transposase
MSKATRRRYTAEFKAEAVALVQDQGYTIADAARALGIDRKLLDRWMAKAREQPEPGAAADSRDTELARLREEVRKLRIEKEIPKKPPSRSHGFRSPMYRNPSARLHRAARVTNLLGSKVAAVRPLVV